MGVFSYRGVWGYDYYFEDGRVRIAHGDYQGIDPMQDPRLATLVRTSMKLHEAIVEAVPEVGQCEYLRMTLADNNVRRKAGNFHYDATIGGKIPLWRAFLAFDRFGTICKDPENGSTSVMPAGMINEFYPDTFHAAPYSLRLWPMRRQRTFMRAAYSSPLTD